MMNELITNEKKFLGQKSYELEFLNKHVLDSLIFNAYANLAVFYSRFNQTRVITIDSDATSDGIAYVLDVQLFFMKRSKTLVHE